MSDQGKLEIYADGKLLKTMDLDEFDFPPASKEPNESDTCSGSITMRRRWRPIMEGCPLSVPDGWEECNADGTDLEGKTDG